MEPFQFKKIKCQRRFAFFKLLLAGDKDQAATRDKTVEKDVVRLCNQVLKSFKTDRQMT